MYALVSMYMRRVCVVYIVHAPQAGRQAGRYRSIRVWDAVPPLYVLYVPACRIYTITHVWVCGMQYLLAGVVNEDIDAGRRVVLARQRLEVCCLKRLHALTPLLLLYLFIQHVVTCSQRARIHTHTHTHTQNQKKKMAHTTEPLRFIEAARCLPCQKRFFFEKKIAVSTEGVGVA